MAHARFGVWTVAALAGLAVAAGCGRYFTPDIELKRRLSDAEVVGTWELTPESLELAKKAGYLSPPRAVHRISLAADGTCRFSSLSGFGSEKTYWDAPGTWKLEHDKEYRGDPHGLKNELELTVKTAKGNYGFAMDFTEEKGTTYLWNFLDDPDDWELLKYARVR